MLLECNEMQSKSWRLPPQPSLIFWPASANRTVGLVDRLWDPFDAGEAAVSRGV